VSLLKSDTINNSGRATNDEGQAMKAGMLSIDLSALETNPVNVV
jgi:hypothetical protein